MFITTKTHNEALAALTEKFKTQLAETKTEWQTKFDENNAATKEHLRSEIETLLENLDKFTANSLENLKNTADELFDEALKRDRIRRYESDEPFVEIISESVTEDGGVNLRLDWNQAFIKHLRAGGMQGATDELLIDNWISSLNSERQAGAAGR